jgi:hypothetical protein
MSRANYSLGIIENKIVERIHIKVIIFRHKNHGWKIEIISPPRRWA